jgi:hypothetical protein
MVLTQEKKQCIDDADISCEFPVNLRNFYSSNQDQIREESNAESTFDFFLCITRYARLCSKVKRCLYSVTAFAHRTHTLFSIVEELHHDVGRWYESVPSSLRLEVPVSMANLPRGRMFIQAVVLHCCYKYLVCIIHSRLMRKVFWSRRDSGVGFEATDVRRLEKSAEASVKAARSIILLTRYVDVDNYTPSW